MNNEQHEQVEQTEETSASKELTQCKLELQTAKDAFVRLGADFENYKKRILKEQAQWLTTIQMDFLRGLLSIVDNFDRAFAQPTATEECKNLLMGFSLIYRELQKFLKDQQVHELVVGEQLDPELHEAIMQVDAPEKESGMIVGVLEKGYTFKNQLLRPAKVSVAK